jgi:hypothetical protein
MKKRNNSWTEKEIEYLLNNIDLPRAELAQQLNRELGSIYGKIRELENSNIIEQHPKRVTYHYQRHTNECGGIDPIVVDRIVNAGTIEQYAQKHPVCDCERAYILKYVPDGNRILLFPKPYTRERLLSIPV